MKVCGLMRREVGCVFVRGVVAGFQNVRSNSATANAVASSRREGGNCDAILCDRGFEWTEN